MQKIVLQLSRFYRSYPVPKKQLHLILVVLMWTAWMRIFLAPARWRLPHNFGSYICHKMTSTLINWKMPVCTWCVIKVKHLYTIKTCFKDKRFLNDFILRSIIGIASVIYRGQFWREQGERSNLFKFWDEWQRSCLRGIFAFIFTVLRRN